MQEDINLWSVKRGSNRKDDIDRLTRRVIALQSEDSINCQIEGCINQQDLSLMQKSPKEVRQGCIEKEIFLFFVGVLDLGRGPLFSVCYLAFGVCI